MANVGEQDAVVARAGRPFTFTRTRGNATADFFPGAGTRLRFASSDTDTLVLPGLPPGTIQPGDLVAAAYKGTTVFRGTVSGITERQGRGTDRVEDVTVDGPWGLMSRLVYRQAWAVGDSGVTQSSARLVLNRTQFGLEMDMTDQVLDIAGFAATACGFTATDTNIDAGDQVLPADEARDITCADAIRRTLRFFPQTVCRFDYSRPTPEFHVSIPPANPTQASYIASIPKTTRTIVRTANPVARVDIATEDVDMTSADGTPLRGITHQVYPPYPTSGTDPIREVDTLHVFMPLDKGSASSSWESMDVETIDADDQWGGYHNPSFWIANHPSLAGLAYTPGGTNGITEFGPVTPATPPYPRMTNTTVGDLERFGLSAEVARLSCPVTITTPDKEEKLVLTLDYVFTNARTRSYTRQTGSSSTAGETMPEGLAEAIYRQRSGTITAEDMTIRLGDALPTLGDALVENVGNTTETLYLQNYEIDCYDLTAKLHFRRPAYLSPEEMRDLLLGFRQRGFSSVAPTRGDPDEAQDADDVGGVQPLKSSSWTVSSVKKATINGGDGAGKIVLDGAKVDSGKIIDTATLTYKDATGEEKEVQILGTDDVNLTEAAAAAVAADPDNYVEVDGKTIYASVRTDEETGESLVGLSETAPEDDDEGDDYCNSIAEERGDADGGGNGISGGGTAGGGGTLDDYSIEGNGISAWPCRKEDDAGGNDL